MKHRLYIAAVLLAWAGAMAWLIRYEAYPERFGAGFGGYREFFSRGLMVMDRWMLITFKGSRIGYTHTQVDVDEGQVVNKTHVKNETVLRMKILDRMQTVRVDANATLDALYNLQTFKFILSTRGYSISLNGVRALGNRFTVHMRTSSGQQILRVEIPPDAVLYSPMMELALRQLEPGRQLRLKTFNPATMQTENVLVRAVRRERITVDGAAQEATLLVATAMGVNFDTWIDTDGQILRQETPFGWTMEKCEPGEAIKAETDADQTGDMLTALAVVASHPIPEPRACRELHLRLNGPMIRDVAYASHRQHIARQADRMIELTSYAERPPAPAEQAAPLPPAVAPFLAATPFLQADDPAVRRQARDITARSSNRWEQALAINAWVYRHVRKVPTVSLPSTRAVLDQLEGDCNEHTYLFVGLARAAGIPAKIMVGLVYSSEGAFYYHAWPAVYIGRWVEMDPTLGQACVDATHIALLEGELSNQMKLMGVVGRLQIDVLPLAAAPRPPGA